MKPIFVISDLHLSDAHPETLTLFQHFVQQIALAADSLFILGDLFEVWMGDDANTSGISQALKLLSDYAQTGRKIFVIRGNRDFLLGRGFERATQSKLLGDHVLLNQTEAEMSAINAKILLMHGDLLCTEDQRYQRFRKFVHRSWVKRLFLSLPLTWRRRIANKLRRSSQNYGANAFQKRPDILDVSPQGISDIRSRFTPSCLIHGHTHRLNIHRETGFTRIVLGDWHNTGSFVESQADKRQLFSFDVAQTRVI